MTNVFFFIESVIKIKISYECMKATFDTILDHVFQLE